MNINVYNDFGIKTLRFKGENISFDRTYYKEGLSSIETDMDMIEIISNNKNQADIKK